LFLLDLTTAPVDLVITAIDDDQSVFLRKQAWYDSVTLWCSRKIAPILCLCPPEEKVCYITEIIFLDTVPY